VIILAFVLFALGGHELRYTLLADVTIQGSLATRQTGHPLRLMGYGVLAVTALLGLQWRRPRATWADRRLLWCMVVTFAWMGLSVLWSHITYLSIKTLVGGLLLWVSSAGIARQMTLNAIRTASLLYAAAAILLGVICEGALGTWMPFTPGYRFCGTTDPYAQGLISISVMCLLSCTLFARSSRRRCSVTFRPASARQRPWSVTLLRHSVLATHESMCDGSAWHDYALTRYSDSDTVHSGTNNGCRMYKRFYWLGGDPGSFWLYRDCDQHRYYRPFRAPDDVYHGPHLLHP
jgi:hypothetical protein